jgi:hypothetical protein
MFDAVYEDPDLFAFSGPVDILLDGEVLRIIEWDILGTSTIFLLIILITAIASVTVS